MLSGTATLSDSADMVTPSRVSPRELGDWDGMDRTLAAAWVGDQTDGSGPRPSSTHLRWRNHEQSRRRGWAEPFMIPRRVYTQAHMDVVAESVAEVWDHRAAVRGLETVYEPSDRRFFQARFQPVD